MNQKMKRSTELTSEEEAFEEVFFDQPYEHLPESCFRLEDENGNVHWQPAFAPGPRDITINWPCVGKLLFWDFGVRDSNRSECEAAMRDDPKFFEQVMRDVYPRVASVVVSFAE